MRQNHKSTSGIVLDYRCPNAEVALLKQLLAENEMLVSFDLETARISKPPTEFAVVEESGVVESTYCLVLDDSRRKRSAS